MFEKQADRDPPPGPGGACQEAVECTRVRPSLLACRKYTRTPSRGEGVQRARARGGACLRAGGSRPRPSPPQIAALRAALVAPWALPTGRSQTGNFTQNARRRPPTLRLLTFSSSVTYGYITQFHPRAPPALPRSGTHTSSYAKGGVVFTRQVPTVERPNGATCYSKKGAKLAALGSRRHWLRSRWCVLYKTACCARLYSRC